jgi:hypothetical protein
MLDHWVLGEAVEGVVPAVADGGEYAGEGVN